jgi:hypothetical protein
MSEATIPFPTTELPNPDRLRQLEQRARQGDASALPELRQALDDQPEVWRRCGDLATQAESAWLGLACGPDLLLRVALTRRLDELKQELAGLDPSPLEKLLVGRVAALWLQVHYADAVYAQAKGPTVTPALLRELQGRQESAERRYQAALKQLALVRKLLRPAAAPIEVASRLEGGGRLGRGEAASLKAASLKGGVGVLN